MAMRDDAHRLIDALADQELPFAVKVLRSLRHRGQESAQSFKDLLLAIPPVGEETDFERPMDTGRTPSDWDT